MNTIYLLLVLIYYARTDDTFIAFDCADPQNTEFFDHKICHKHSDRLIKQEFVIVQARMVEKSQGTCVKEQSPHNPDIVGATVTINSLVRTGLTSQSSSLKKHADGWLKKKHLTLVTSH